MTHCDDDERRGNFEKFIYKRVVLYDTVVCLASVAS